MAQPKDTPSISVDSASDVEAKHRGVLKGRLPVPGFLSPLTLTQPDGKVTAACSTDYLVSLVLEVLRAKASPMVKLTQPTLSDEEQISRLEFVITEVQRLFRNPGLFPSDSVRARFAAALALDSDLYFAEAVKELLLSSVQNDIEKYNRETFTRPCYKPGSKGWENFLLNNGPGAPKDSEPPNTTPASAYQFIPAVGMRIVGDANREEAIVANWIQQVRAGSLNCLRQISNCLIQNPNPPKVDPAVTTRLMLMNMVYEALSVITSSLIQRVGRSRK